MAWAIIPAMVLSRPSSLREVKTSPAALSVSFVLLGYIARLLFYEPIRVSGSLAAPILDANVVVCQEPITNSGRWLAALELS